MVDQTTNSPRGVTSEAGPEPRGAPSSQTTEMVAREPAEKLARLLDTFAGDLANDLEWALRVIDLLADRCRSDIQDANRYAEAHRHLKARRAFEERCKSL